MKVTRILIFLILTINVGSKSIAQSDHLEPTRGIFDIYDYQFEYYSKVRKVLFDGLTDSPEVRLLIMPSFSPENILDIENDRKNQKYYMEYHIGEKMVWDNENWEKVKVLKYRKEISKESVELIKDLFETAIKGTMYPKEENMGLDGERYYFSVNKLGLKTGITWSPDEGTRMDKLVKIGYKLIELTKTKSELITFDEKLKDEIVKLTNALK